MNCNDPLTTERGEDDLKKGLCPYCQGELEGTMFTGEDGREGGLVECPFCERRYAWIDNPFEVEMQRAE